MTSTPTPTPTIAPPTVEREPFLTLVVTLRPTDVGQTPFGFRREVFFEGTATSELWDGEWSANGIDHIVVGDGGVVRIDVHVNLCGPDETVVYRGHGRAGAAGVVGGVTFETTSERLAALNTTVAVGRGTVDGDQLTVTLYRIQV